MPASALLNQGFAQEGVPVPAPMPAPRGVFNRRGVVMAADTLMIGPIAHGRHHLSRAGQRAETRLAARSFGGRHMFRMEAAVTEAVAHGNARIRAVHALRLLGHHHGSHHLIARAGRMHAANTLFAESGATTFERV